MKKLSEIGQHFQAFEEPDPNTPSSEVWILTKDERRELVESAIAGFITKEIESRTSLYILQTRLSEFLKEQGL